MCLRRGLEKGENADLGRKMPFLDGHYFFFPNPPTFSIAFKSRTPSTRAKAAHTVPGSERPNQSGAISRLQRVVAPITRAQRAEAAIAAQKVCPVSGHPLDSMGKPILITIGEDTIYVCCAGCIDAVKANPGKYLAKKAVLKIAPSTDADAEAIALQKLCPVMDEPLGSMGTPLKVSGLERDVFLCCKGCVKFLEKEPAKFLAKLPPLHEDTHGGVPNN